MILLKPFLFSLFVILIYTNDRYHLKYSLKGEETVRRFEREANLKVENIKEKRFDRIYVYQNPDNIIQETTKLRTKVECAGLCLSIKACFGFQWSRSKENDLYSCKVFKRQELCKWNEEPSTEIYVGQNENIANCVRYKDPCKPYDGFPNDGTAPQEYVLPNVDHPLQRDPWFCCAKKCGTKAFRGKCGGKDCYNDEGCCPKLLLKSRRVELHQSSTCKEKKSSPCLYPPLIGPKEGTNNGRKRSVENTEL